MAHFAKISEQNIVLQVLTLNDENTLDPNGVENELIGQQYLEKHNNWPAHLWIKTSYHTFENKHAQGKTPFRGNYAGVGFQWDPVNEIFWFNSPYPSWIKNIETASWKSPLGDKPELTQEQKNQNTALTHNWSYYWDEAAYQADNNTGWILINSLS